MPPAPIANRRRAGADMSDHHGRRRTGNARHVVMLREPEALVAPPLRVLREIERVAKRIGRGAALNDWRKVENERAEPFPIMTRNRERWPQVGLALILHPVEGHLRRKEDLRMSYVETSDGTKLYYKDWGTGRPVVMMHGWPLSSDTFDDLSMALADNGFRAISYDRRGFGRSHQPWEGYDYDTLADDLAAVLAHTKATDVTLLGFSMGGGEVPATCRGTALRM